MKLSQYLIEYKYQKQLFNNSIISKEKKVIKRSLKRLSKVQVKNDTYRTSKIKQVKNYSSKVGKRRAGRIIRTTPKKQSKIRNTINVIIIYFKSSLNKN